MTEPADHQPTFLKLAFCSHPHGLPSTCHSLQHLAAGQLGAVITYDALNGLYLIHLPAEQALGMQVEMSLSRLKPRSGFYANLRFSYVQLTQRFTTSRSHILFNVLVSGAIE